MYSLEEKEQYDFVDELAYQLLTDYEILKFPINPNELCRKLKYNFVPYSAFGEQKKLPTSGAL